MNKKVILITGCSSGFGLGMAVQLAKRHTVIATMRNLAKKDALEKQLSNVGVEAVIKQLDVNDKASIQKTIDDVKQAFGRLDVLINNAGHLIVGSFEDTSDDECRNQMETNFFGLLNVTRSALPLLRDTKNAKIINMSSIAGLSGTPLMGAYNASKWAVEGFSESLRHELSKFDVQVVNIEPGAFKTEILDQNLQFSEGLNNQESPYHHFSKSFITNFQDHAKKFGGDPNDVVKLVEKIIDSKKPSFRNIIGKGTKLRYYIQRFLPFSIYEVIVKLYLNRSAAKAVKGSELPDY